MHWISLHRHALTFEGDDDSEYIQTFTSQVPKYTSPKCKCVEFWQGWLKMNPPTYDDYFAWTVRAHNAVNVKLGKKHYTVDDARRFYTTMPNAVELHQTELPTVRNSQQIVQRVGRKVKAVAIKPTPVSIRTDVRRPLTMKQMLAQKAQKNI